MTMRRVDSGGVVVSPLWGAPDAQARSDAGEAAARQRMEQELDAARERGYQEGYARGLEQAQAQVRKEAEAWHRRQEGEMAEARKRLEDGRKRLETLIDALSPQVDRHLANAGEVAVSVAYAAVVKFLGDGHADRSLMRKLVQHALAHVEQHVDCVRLSKQDAELVQGLDSVKVVGDARLSPGQCVLETRLGHYETGLDVRLDLLKTALLSGLAQHHAEGAQA